MSGLTFSQKEDKIQDSIKHVRNASLLSTFIPGAGQVYNHIHMPKGQKKALWKLPIYYSLIGTTGYFLIKNNHLQNSYKTELKNRIAGQDPSQEFLLLDDYSLQLEYNQALNQRDLFIVFFGLSYLVQIVDAAVEAHFLKFDVSENLTLSYFPTYYSSSIGLGISLNFVK